MKCRKKPFLASSQLAFDMLSTCLRPGLQLARIMECGLYRIPEIPIWWQVAVNPEMGVVLDVLLVLRVVFLTYYYLIS